MTRRDEREVKSRATQLDKQERQRVEQEVDQAAGTVERHVGRSAYRNDQTITRIGNRLARTERAIAEAEEALNRGADSLEDDQPGGGGRRR